MELNKYQEKAMKTCMSSCDNFSYMMMNLVGEVGEFASKVAKLVRKDKAVIYSNKLGFRYKPTETEDIIHYREELKLEAGDILWQLAGLCKVMGWSLEDVAQMNLDKLKSRKERGVIDGNGDNR